MLNIISTIFLIVAAMIFGGLISNLLKKWIERRKAVEAIRKVEQQKSFAWFLPEYESAFFRIQKLRQGYPKFDTSSFNDRLSSVRKERTNFFLEKRYDLLESRIEASEVWADDYDEVKKILREAKNAGNNVSLYEKSLPGLKKKAFAIIAKRAVKNLYTGIEEKILSIEADVESVSQDTAVSKKERNNIKKELEPIIEKLRKALDLFKKKLS
jgi:hypothetical protein